VAANALELSKNGVPKKPFYMTGSLGGKGFSVHAEGERMILTREGEEREEVELGQQAEVVAPEPQATEEELPRALCPQGIVTAETLEDDQELPPGQSVLDGLAAPVVEGGEA
jgi:hypothetical protein